MLTAEAQARLLTYHKDYLIDEVECAPLMYKVIMRLATIDSVATTQALRDNLHALGMFASTVSGDIDKINSEFDKNYSQIIACSTTVDNPIGILFSAYQVIPCYHFKSYINRMHKAYLDEKLATLTHKSLVGMAKSKFNYLCTKGTWGAKSPNDDKIIAMTTTFDTLKGQLKLSPQLAAAGGKNDGKPKKGQKMRNKKNTSVCVKQKKDEAWKKVPPKEGEKKEKVHDKRTYHWCVHHMAWTMHLPSECHLGTERKGEKQKQVLLSRRCRRRHHQSTICGPSRDPGKHCRQRMMVQASMDVSSNVDIHGWAQQFGYRTIFDLSSRPLPANLHPNLLPLSHPTRSLPATSHLQCVHPGELLAAPGEQTSCPLQASQ